jgi:glycosyltransferase involved in cell wall biosynthesis
MTRARRAPTEPDDERPSTSASSPVDARRKHCVMMLSDFFLPSIGGVELHIYALATRLRARGHKVVVYTHAHPGRVGVRWITRGIKVYHVPRVVMYDNCTFPNFLGGFKLFRKVRRRRRRGRPRRRAREVSFVSFVSIVSFASTDRDGDVRWFELDVRSRRRDAGARAPRMHDVARGHTVRANDGNEVRVHRSLVVWFRGRRGDSHE